MREELACALNNKEFLSLDPCLYINDIEEQAKLNTETAKRPHYGLMLVSAPGHETLTVTVSFMIKMPNRIKRQQIIQKVNEWAKEGWLETNIRPYQRLYVVCTQPATTEAYKWSEEMKIVFTAYNESYWQSTVPVTATGSGTSVSLTINPLGTRQCCLEAQIKNNSSSSMSTVSITTNGKTMAFEGLAMAQNDILSIGYDENHILYAKVGNTSKLNCRTAASADDLWLNPSTINTVSVTCQRSSLITISARGAYE